MPRKLYNLSRGDIFMSSDKENGQKMKAARKKLGWTQAQVAEKVGIGVNYYAEIERGEKVPSDEKRKALMKLLGIKSLVISVS